MFVAQIQFPFDSTEENDEAEDIASDILDAMYFSGQISSNEYGLLESPQGFASFVLVPDEEALHEKHNDTIVEMLITRFMKVGGRRPQFIIVGRNLESLDACECTQPSSYVLYTTFISFESPLRCAFCFGPVPLYRVRPEQESEYWKLGRWEADYKACDTLQMGCTVLERSTMRQMSQPNSALTKLGLEVCRLISASTKQPVYYYLYVQTGANIDLEVARKCPKCGGDWLLKEPWHGKFDFKCDKCHLLSNIAFDVREAYIAED